MITFSGIILAGGLSSRMGVDKTTLQILGKTMLEWQTEKLRHAGAAEILLCGMKESQIPDVRCIPDVLPGRGPLGGIYSGLLAAKHARSLIISADVPLLPVKTLQMLLNTHKSDVTLLSHHGQVEPLIGIYEKSLVTTILSLIEQKSASVWALLDRCIWNTLEFAEDENLLYNCNTPDDYAAVQRLAEGFLVSNEAASD